MDNVGWSWHLPNWVYLREISNYNRSHQCFVLTVKYCNTFYAEMLSDRCNIGYMGVISESVGAITLLVFMKAYGRCGGQYSGSILVGYPKVLYIGSMTGAQWLVGGSIDSICSERLLFWGY